MDNKKKKKSTIREYIEAFAVAGILAFIIRTFLFQAFKIPSGSMVPTLLIGDHIIVEKFLYHTPLPFSSAALRNIKHGDIIVFEYPKDPEKDFIKRVIGLPGDIIEIKAGTLWLNSQPVREQPAPDGTTMPPDENGTLFIEEINSTKHRTLHKNQRSMLSMEYGPVTVPADSYFVMGDNRDNSSDSRVWGFVKTDAVKGKAFMIYWSLGEDGFRPKRIGNIIK